MNPPLLRYVPLLVLLLLHIAQLAHYYPLLPDPVASHFGVNGIPNGWMSKTQYLLLNLFFVALTGLLAFGLPLFLRILPASLINIPHREYWLAPERRRLAEHMLSAELCWIAALFYAVLLATNQLAIAANFRQPPRLSDSIWAILGAATILIVLWLWRLYRIFRPPPPSPG